MQGVAPSEVVIEVVFWFPTRGAAWHSMTERVSFAVRVYPLSENVYGIWSDVWGDGGEWGACARVAWLRAMAHEAPR